MEPKQRKNRYNLMSKWCFLRNNTRLKTIIQYEMKAQDISMRELARRTDIKVERISRYFNTKTGWCTQHQIITICKELGLKVDLVITKQD